MINIDVRAWVVGTIIVFTAALGWMISEYTMTQLIDFAHTQTLPASAWDAINLLVGIFRPVMIIMAASGLIYIIYSSLGVEREQQYGGRVY
jgi:hypothetical protein